MTPTPTEEDLRLLALLEKAITVDLVWKAGDAMAGTCFQGDAVRHALAAFHAEARREAQERERSYLISCPWCGEHMNKQAISYQMAHVIGCGDKRGQSEREACERIVEEYASFRHGAAGEAVREVLRRLRERAK